MQNKYFTSAIIVAAGSSVRMNCPGNKNYLPIQDIPALSLTLKAFDECTVIDEIVLVYKKEELSFAIEAVKCAGVKKNVSYAIGGTTRQESVYNGILAVSPSCNYVAIHDGARVMITPEVIEKVMKAAYESGAATSARKVTDTLCTLNESLSEIGEYINRDSCALIQTPQCFDYSLIKKAHDEALKEHVSATDDTSLIKRLGREVKLVFTDGKNLKLTHPEDVVIARAIIESRQNNNLNKGENENAVK